MEVTVARPRASERRHRGVAMAAVLVALATAMLGLMSGTASAAPASGTPSPSPSTSPSPSGTPAPSTGAGAGSSARVVLIGVPGLRWDDVRPSDTPNLWRLAGQGAVGVLSAKAVGPYACPIDGWLTVSAGQRSQLRHGSCGLPPAPVHGTVPGFAAIRDDNAHNKYGSKIGLLGDAIHRAGGCTMAVGPGGMLGAADHTGRVDAYAPSTGDVPAGGWSRCALTVVDVDDVYRAYIDAGVDVNGRQVPVTAKKRAEAAARADERIGKVLAALPAGTTVLLAGLSDSAHAARLHVAMATGPGYRSRYLTADSTRTGGLVTLTDVTATILHTLGIPRPEGAVGSPWRLIGPKSASTHKVVRALDARDAAARGYSRMVNPFKITLLVIQIGLYAIATVALRRKRGRLLAATRLLALAAAALPIASFLANVYPWWSAGHPEVVMSVLIVAFVTVLAAAAGPWRRSVTGAGAVVAGVTVVVLTLDVMTGSHLQNCSVLGYTPLVAGRFYGFGNPPWALWITGAILAAGASAGGLLRKERRGAATALVVAVGVAALVVDGAPMWGADFGGIIATFPGFAVFALMISGRRIRPSRLLAVPAAGAVLVLGVAYLDSLRANPTHIGEFWDSLVNGDAGTIVFRKFRGMVGTFGNWELSVLAAVAVVFLVFALLRPLAWRGAALHLAYERSPALRPTLVAVLVTIGIGMLVNDSGVAIPAMAVTLVVPLALAASVRALELDASEPPTRARPPRETPASKA